MAEQTDLFGIRPRSPRRSAPDPLPAARDRKTSTEAAHHARRTVSKRRAAVFEALERGPKTDEQICKATGLDGNTVRPRRQELLKAGQIEDSGRKALTQSGREAIVWRVVVGAKIA